MSIGRRILKFTASLKLAVIVILGLAVISAVGTITEARYNDAMVANKLVYTSPWMYVILSLLCVNLIGVMIDRWPWKQHHAGFVLGHIFILHLVQYRLEQRMKHPAAKVWLDDDIVDLVQLRPHRERFQRVFTITVLEASHLHYV